MKKPSILLIGYDEHLCLSILYTLRNTPAKFHLLTHKKKSVLRFSRFMNNIYEYVGHEDIPAAIQKISKEINIDLIMPFDELETLEVSRHKDMLSKIAPVVPVTDPELFAIAINKQNLGSYLREQGLDVNPKSVELSKDSKPSDLKDLKFPILLKPSRSSFGRGIITVHNTQELEKAFEKKKDFTGHAAQEFITGSDITCNIFAIDGQVKHYTIQESPVKGVNNYAKNDDLIYHDDQQVIDMVSDIAKSLNWNGIACVDLRRDAQTGQVYLLEINGRFWGSVSGAYDKANVNFPLIMINHALYHQETIVEKKDGYQVSVNQLVKELKSLKFKNLTKTKYQSYFHDPLARFLKYLPR